MSHFSQRRRPTELMQWLNIKESDDSSVFEKALNVSISMSLPGEVLKDLERNECTQDLVFRGLLGPPEVAKHIILSYIENNNRFCLLDQLQLESKDNSCYQNSLSKETKEKDLENIYSQESVLKKYMKEVYKKYQEAFERILFYNNIKLESLLWYFSLCSLFIRFSNMLLMPKLFIEFFLSFALIVCICIWLAAFPEKVKTNYVVITLKAVLSMVLVLWSNIIPHLINISCEVNNTFVYSGLIVLCLIAISYTECKENRILTQSFAFGSLLLNAYIPCVSLLKYGQECIRPTNLTFIIVGTIAISGMFAAIVRYTGYKAENICWLKDDKNINHNRVKKLKS